MSTVKEGNTVKVHYKGTLEDGTEFDNSKTKITFVPEIRDKITQGGGWR